MNDIKKCARSVHECHLSANPEPRHLACCAFRCVRLSPAAHRPPSTRVRWSPTQPQTLIEPEELADPSSRQDSAIHNPYRRSTEDRPSDADWQTRGQAPCCVRVLAGHPRWQPASLARWVFIASLRLSISATNSSGGLLSRGRRQRH